MSKNKKSKKYTDKNVDVWTEEQYEEYLKEIYGMEFIAGFAEGGVNKRLIDINTNYEYRIKEEMNYFNIKHITDAEKYLFLCYYYGITNECIELEIKDKENIDKV